MSLRVKQYKLVGRDFLNRMLSNLKERDCKYCCKIQIIKLELERSGFDTFNKDVECWRIVEGASEIIVTPEVDSETEEES